MVLADANAEVTEDRAYVGLGPGPHRGDLQMMRASLGNDQLKIQAVPNRVAQLLFIGQIFDLADALHPFTSYGKHFAPLAESGNNHDLRPFKYRP